MLRLEDPVETAEGIYKTLRQLAEEGGVTISRISRFRPEPKAVPRPVWWAHIGPDRRRYEISGSVFRALIRLHVPQA